MIKHLHALYLGQMRRYILWREVNIVFYLHILTLREISNEQVHTYYNFVFIFAQSQFSVLIA